MRRGELWWATLPEPTGSGPGYRRPLLVIQSDEFNESAIRTTLALALTTNLRLSEAPGNVGLPARKSGLARESVINVSQVITVDKSFLTERIGRLDPATMATVEDGLRLVLSL